MNKPQELTDAGAAAQTIEGLLTMSNQDDAVSNQRAQRSDRHA